MSLDFRKWTAEEMKNRPRRASTRWLLAGSLAVLAVLPIAEMLSSGASGTLPNTLPFMVPLLVGTMRSPFMRDTSFTERGMAQYDEFERAAIAAAMRRAYLTVFVLLGCLFLWLAIGEYHGWPLPSSTRQWLSIGFALLFAMLALPTTYAEFMVPMPDPEDELL
ncbi:hypothetical protein ASE86_04030 [Sphingomonas sp. Leaf33]|uniref:hypothetical protein n=1 Tax=Sphingomonas sp. Leaf33 TaxID=1736215 RepID=UPI0006F2B3E1|nr:hypothetical protein [Sphingomonas sp. Leaf33]KQN25416.1 hypothetical protein ASE86_04030 [Sphingomonas sp. Leaf33]